MEYRQVEMAHDEAHGDDTKCYVSVLDSVGVDLRWQTEQRDPGYKTGDEGEGNG